MGIVRKYTVEYPEGDVKIVEVFRVGDNKYSGGIMYNFRYLACRGNAGEYETAFAIDNSHGQPHMHKGDKKEYVELGWKQAAVEFDRMVKDYRKNRYGED